MDAPLTTTTTTAPVSSWTNSEEKFRPRCAAAAAAERRLQQHQEQQTARATSNAGTRLGNTSRISLCSSEGAVFFFWLKNKSKFGTETVEVGTP